ncbi:MAG: phosphomannomutase/phosphoglucomutase [Bdellovibrionales bacterium]|nr:phosphomannomutase/phosphoglucomutase [Bdellovibrionales bacterium]
MNPKIFREYDIRGEVGKDFDSSFARNLGKAFAVFVKQRLGRDDLTIAVGRDCRLTGPEISEALIEGLCDGGINVVSSGMGATPQLYFTVFSRDLDGGIQVTASHNPAPDNGFKLMAGKHTMSGKDIAELKRILDSGPDSAPKRGTVEEFDAARSYADYLVEISQDQVNKDRTIKVVVDGGNGAGGPVGVDVLKRLGCEVIELYTDPDGRFPNHHPDPTVLENIAELRSRVVSESADLGIAWDGDADRIGVVDERGEVIWGDMLLLLYGRAMCEEVNSPTVIGDVKCSELLFSKLKEAGANPVMWKTGHSLIKAKLKELGAELAGEMSGHMFFVHRYYGYDDAIHASARLVEILSNTDKKLSQLLSDVPKSFATPEIRKEVPEDNKFEIVAEAQVAFPEFETNTLDGIRITFDHGWGLVRASNTQAVLVLRFEADSQERLDQYQNLVEERLENIIQSI